MTVATIAGFFVYDVNIKINAPKGVITMESIQVTTENLRTKADEVSTKATEYLRHYESFLNSVTTLTSTDWKGDDATAFKNQVEGFREDFVRMKNLMDDYAAFLRSAAANYEETQGNVIGTIKSLQN